jgi:ABC-type uncharacterized transport system ATPase subunit
MHPIVYISHRMEEVYRIADRITILQDGRTFSTLMPIFWTSAGAKPAPTLYGVDADVFASVVRVQQAIASVTRLPPRHWQGA